MCLGINKNSLVKTFDCCNFVCHSYSHTKLINLLDFNVTKICQLGTEGEVVR